MRKSIHHIFTTIIICLFVLVALMPGKIYASGIISDNTDPETFKAAEQSARESSDGDIMLFSDNSRTIKGLGVDVFSGNEVIDWKKVKAAGIDFAFIRVGYRGWGKAGTLCKDITMTYNLQNAKSVGIKVGVYFYATAVSVAEAKAEAAFVLSLLNGISLDYPVCYDYEGYDQDYSRNYNISAEQRTQFAITFLDAIEAAGYKGMMYSSAAHFRDNAEWDTDKLEDKYDIWVAQYWLSSLNEEFHDLATAKDRESSYTGTYRFWQCSSQGKVDGISGDVDLDIEYTDPGTSSPLLQDQTSGKSTTASDTVTSTKTSSTTASGTTTSAKTSSTSTSASDTATSAKTSSTTASGTTTSAKTSSTTASGTTTSTKTTSTTASDTATSTKTTSTTASSEKTTSASTVKKAVYVSMAAVKYRNKPGFKGKVLGTIPKGTKVKVYTGYIKVAGGYTWYKMTYGSKTVYAAACYFRPRTMTNVKYATYKTTAALRYRSMPTSYGKCIGVLSKGKKIKVVTGYSVKAGGITWYRFKYKGKYYYAAATYLKKQ